MSEKERTERLRKNANEDHREKATDTHSASWWRWVTRLAGLVLISWSLLGSQAMAQECYQCGSSKSDDGHDAYAENDRVVSLDDSNAGKDRNSLWNSVKRACIDCTNDKCDTSWSYTHCCYNKAAAVCKVQGVGRYPVVILIVKDCHFLLVPTDRVTGVEDTLHRDTHPYWNWVWLAAATPYNPIKHKVSDNSIGLAINPKTHRGQDQLHIHIGSLRNFLRGLLSEKYVPHNGNWHQLPARDVYGKTCHAKFVNSSPFPSPFKEVSGHFGEGNMQHAGIILAGHVEGGILKGYYIVSCYDTFVEDWLYYNCPGQ